MTTTKSTHNSARIWRKALLVACVAFIVFLGTSVGICYAVATKALQSSLDSLRVSFEKAQSNFQRSVQEALTGLSVAASSLGGMGRLDDAAFYSIARHLSAQKYATGHISLLSYITDDQREAAENQTAQVWGFPTPISQRNANGTLEVAPRRPYYAIYTLIYDLRDPTLRDFAAFDLLSIPLRAAA